MRALATPCLLSSLALALSAQAPIPLKTTLSKVTLHPDQSWILRKGIASFEKAGTFRLAISDLPPGLTVDDLQVSARGPSGTRLGEVGLRSDPKEIKETAEYLRFKHDRDALERRMQQEEVGRQALESGKQFLQSLMNAHQAELAKCMGSNLPSSSALLELASAIETRKAELAQQEWALTEEKEAIALDQKQCSDLEQQLRNQRQQAPTTALVEVTITRPGSVEIALNQRSTAASWSPTYEARLSSDRKKVELVLFASITQRTGEDWKDVALEIATREGSTRLDAPSEPQAHFLSFREGHRANGTSQSGSTRSLTIPSLRVALEGTADIPSGSEAQRFKVVAWEQEPTLRYLAMPRESTEVFLSADLKPPASFPLYAQAPLQLLAGTQRLGSQRLSHPTFGQPLSLSFGPYPGLTAQWRLHERKRAEVGTFTKEREWTFVERLEIGNATSESLQIELSDRRITSSTESLTVETDEGTTPGWKDLPNGRRSWTLTVAPSAKQTVELKTRIRAPKEGRVLNVGDLPLEGN
jgi:hypothetical protein